MSEQVLVETSSAIIRYDKDHNYIHHTIKTALTGKAFRDMLNTGLDLFMENGATKWLSDDRRNSGLSQEDTDFGVNDWGSRAAQAGWTHWALVVPDTMSARSSMQATVTSYHSLGVHVRIFTDLDKAREWLIAQ